MTLAKSQMENHTTQTINPIAKHTDERISRTHQSNLTTRKQSKRDKYRTQFDQRKQLDRDRAKSDAEYVDVSTDGLVEDYHNFAASVLDCSENTVDFDYRHIERLLEQADKPPAHVTQNDVAAYLNSEATSRIKRGTTSSAHCVCSFVTSSIGM